MSPRNLPDDGLQDRDRENVDPFEVADLDGVSVAAALTAPTVGSPAERPLRHDRADVFRPGNRDLSLQVAAEALPPSFSEDGTVHQDPLERLEARIDAAVSQLDLRLNALDSRMRSSVADLDRDLARLASELGELEGGLPGIAGEIRKESKHYGEQVLAKYRERLRQFKASLEDWGKATGARFRRWVDALDKKLSLETSSIREDVKKLAGELAGAVGELRSRWESLREPWELALRTLAERSRGEEECRAQIDDLREELRRLRQDDVAALGATQRADSQARASTEDALRQELARWNMDVSRLRVELEEERGARARQAQELAALIEALQAERAVASAAADAAPRTPAAGCARVAIEDVSAVEADAGSPGASVARLSEPLSSKGFSIERLEDRLACLSKALGALDERLNEIRLRPLAPDLDVPEQAAFHSLDPVRVQEDRELREELGQSVKAMCRILDQESTRRDARRGLVQKRILDLRDRLRSDLARILDEGTAERRGFLHRALGGGAPRNPPPREIHELFEQVLEVLDLLLFENGRNGGV